MQVNPRDMQAFEKVVLAGMKVMFDKKTFDLMKNGLLKKDVPIAKRLATETAGLMKLLDGKAKNGIPPQILPSAAAMLLMEMAKFMKEAGADNPTEADIDAALQMLMQLLAQVFMKSGQPQPQPQPQPAPTQQPAGMIQGA